MLALVPSPDHNPSASQPTVSLCSHCAARPRSEPTSRVCEHCGLGLLLHSGADVAPRLNGAFIVLDRSLAVCAVSRGTERLLATAEIDAVNRHVSELVVAADAESQSRGDLAAAVIWAAGGDDATRSVTVRPTNTFGVRMKARIAPCGPSRAALLVFD
jgi:hypothetical protein